jgi:hypothetical protein
MAATAAADHLAPTADCMAATTAAADQLTPTADRMAATGRVTTSRGMTTAAGRCCATKNGECRKEGKKGDALQKRVRIHMTRYRQDMAWHLAGLIRKSEVTNRFFLTVSIDLTVLIDDSFGSSEEAWKLDYIDVTTGTTTVSKATSGWV